MEPQHDLEHRLKTETALLWSLLDRSRLPLEGRIGALEKHIHDAQAREHRRAAFNAVDRDKYALGGAFEPLGGLDLDPVKLTGLLALGQVALVLLVSVALARPGANVIELLKKLFDGSLGNDIRRHGVAVRWHWLSELYREETERFQASTVGNDPDARFRAKKPTKNQIYLINEICRLLQLGSRTFDTRGQAYDWLVAMGGNPRYWEAPPEVDLAKLSGWRP